jgi:hypothetical protein
VCKATDANTNPSLTYTIKYIYSLNDNVTGPSVTQITRVTRVYDCRAYFPTSSTFVSRLEISVKGPEGQIQIPFMNYFQTTWRDPWQCGQFLTTAKMTDGSDLLAIFKYTSDTTSQKGTLTAKTLDEADIGSYSVRITTKHPTIQEITQWKDFTIVVSKCVITKYSTNTPFVDSAIVKLQAAFRVTQPVYTQQPVCGYTETVTLSD